MGNAPAVVVSGQRATLTLPAGGGPVYQLIEEEGPTKTGEIRPSAGAG
jgi:hypothetical protein